MSVSQKNSSKFYLNQCNTQENWNALKIVVILAAEMFAVPP
jgi:hypothetical protein